VARPVVIVTEHQNPGQVRLGIDAALAAGAIDEVRWYAENSRLLETAYLSSADARGQSGLNGDAANWERRRKVIVEAIDRDGSFLDIGCANGSLMETIVVWATERGHDLEAYGLDISPKLAALARTRLPAWTDRIFVGNAIALTPPPASTSSAPNWSTSR
jgi:SAM-dependent methyltransferase